MSDTDPATQFLEHAGERIAYRLRPGREPGVVFLCGYASNMAGTKAAWLDTWCARRGQAFLRLDYQGHGESGGDFEAGTLGRWAGDAQAVIGAVSEGPLVLVGSSMGAWIMLLVALRMPARVRALVGVAPAPDFTVRLLEERLDDAARALLERDGVVRRPSAYGDPLPLTAAFLDEARAHLLLDAPIPIDCPVRLLHGMADPDVPWQSAETLARRLRSADVELTLLKSAGHRLSAPGELARLGAMLGELLDAPAP